MIDNNKALVICDIQKEYEKHFPKGYMYNVGKLLIEYSKNKQSIYWFWNGPELAMSSEDELKDWIYNVFSEYNIFDLDYEAEDFVNTEYKLLMSLFDSITFISKSYGSLRFAIDNYYDNEAILLLLKYMNDLGWLDIRDCTFHEFIIHYDFSNNVVLETVELIKQLDSNRDYFGFDVGIYNDLCKFDSKLEYEMIGGSVDACLLELKLQMMALGLSVETGELTY